MKKYLLFLIALPALIGALSVWKDYPIAVPSQYNHFYTVAVSVNGVGYAFATDGHNNGKQYLLKLRTGQWTPGTAPPVSLARPSVSPDGTLYSIDTSRSGNVYRYEGESWKIVALPKRFALEVFERVAAVGPHEFWAQGTTAEGYVIVVYFQNDQPYKVFYLGQLVEPHGGATASMAVPRTAAPNGDCYIAIQASNNPFNNYRWMLFVLRSDGNFAGYAFPLDQYLCDGISIYQGGNVRIMLTANSNADSRLFSFAGGVFREVAIFPERVRLASYPTPVDGWGRHYPNRIYHWTAGAIAPAVTIDGTVSALDMVSGTEGWAVGSKMVNGESRPAMWHYSDVEPSLTPTSLGRVKAAFK